MIIQQTPFSSSSCYHPVAALELHRSGFFILIVTLYLIDLEMSGKNILYIDCFFMCHSLFMNSHQLAPRVAVFGISTEEEESPFTPLSGGDLHSQETQGLAEPVEHVQ